MPYTPYHADWEDSPSTDTPITAAALEHIEGGVEDAQAAAEAAAASVASLTGVYQAKDATLDTYAGIDPAANVQSILSAADFAAIRTLLGLVIGTNVQAYDADLTTYAGISPSADVQSVLGAANFAAIRTLLGLVIGTNVQAYDADLTTWAGLTPSAFFQTLVDDASAAAARATLGLTAGSIFLSAAGMWPSTTNGAATNAKVDFGTNDQDMYVLDFADGATKLYAQATVAMPSDWDGGTVTATFYWTKAGTSTNSVVWGCAGRSYGDAETIDQSWGTEQTVTDAGQGTADQVHISSATSAITLAGTPAGGEVVQFRVSRDPANGSDTLAATARLLGVMIAYTRA